MYTCIVLSMYIVCDITLDRTATSFVSMFRK